ncbi:MAG: glycoside hydrolase family 20 zincin-like fold domain-containing protein [Planctomycetaceae bacterium]|nr:glycoside hydrolase family 20 zincin-like fold domain-containing protein [Planctomycetaceae bacterium]
MRTLLTATLIAASAAVAAAQEAPPSTTISLVLPAPQVVIGGKEDVTLGRADLGISVALADIKPEEPTLAAGLDLLAKALSKVESKLTRAPEPAEAMLKITKLDAPAFAKAVAVAAPKASLSPEQLAQGYVLTLASKEEKTTIDLKAQTPLGLYYGLCTLVQLVSRGEEGLVAPGATIADWPAVPMRVVDPVPMAKGAVQVLLLLRLNPIVPPPPQNAAAKSSPKSVLVVKEPSAMTTDVTVDGEKTAVFDPTRLHKPVTGTADAIRVVGAVPSPAGTVWASLADYCWNSAAYTPEASARRAKNFASLLEPLLARAGGFKYELEMEK